MNTWRIGVLAGTMMTALARAGEWAPLFNGRDLEGWMSSDGSAPPSGWVAHDGVLKRAAKAGYIWTRARFANFELDLEFLTEGNSGVFFRTDNPKDPVQTGLEIQIHTPGGPNRNSVGAVYDLAAPSRNAARPGWNRMILLASNNVVAVTLNGERIVEMDLDQWTVPGRNPDGSANKFKRAIRDFARSGHIGLQDHGAAVSYRNLRIRALD